MSLSALFHSKRVIDLVLSFLGNVDERRLKCCSKKLLTIIKNFRTNWICGTTVLCETTLPRPNNSHPCITYSTSIFGKDIESQRLIDTSLNMVTSTLVPIDCHLKYNEGIGYGVFSDSCIPAGSNLFIYSGELISSSEVQDRESHQRIYNVIFDSCYISL